jgi:hypothetical protein
MRKKLGFICVSLSFAGASLAVFSCAESTDGVVPSTTSRPDSGVAEGSTSATPTADGSVPPTPSNVTASPALLNEISPSDEWVEIVATGNTAVDLSGFRVADSSKDGGAPKLADAVIFPAGTVLSPKAYLVVKGGGLDGGVGKPCPDGGQSYCFNAQFGISNKSGETIYLLDDKDAVVGSVVYPPSAVPAGASWGRIPSGDPNAAFVANVPSPGAANQAK